MKINQHNIKEELAQLGIDLEHKPGMPLSVPAGYFEDAKKEILENIEVLDLMDSLPKNMPQTLPSNHFEDSKKSILANIAALDFVEKLPKSMPQAVPAGYFEHSKDEIFAKINKDVEKPTLTVTRRNKKQNWALAATMALLVSLGLFFVNPNSSTASIEDSLSQIPSEVLNQYIEENAYDFEALDILENPQTSTTAKLQDLEQQILDETKTMSDEEIFTYLL